jgi:hypothetical protein
MKPAAEVVFDLRDHEARVGDARGRGHADPPLDPVVGAGVDARGLHAAQIEGQAVDGQAIDCAPDAFA